MYQTEQTCTNDMISWMVASQCAPLLFHLKPSNLLIVPSEKKGQIIQMLKNTDIQTRTLYDDRENVFILLYRGDKLMEHLSNKREKDLLEIFGYTGEDLEVLIGMFQIRFECCRKGMNKFPHEMGLFLGYPAEDVEGFILNQGKKALCCGYWKVYDKLEEKLRLFEKFQQAREQMMEMIRNGKSMDEIIWNL